MHASHSPVTPIRQYQTLEIFNRTMPAGFQDSDQNAQVSYYNKTVSAKKDLEAMKVKAAGINKDTLATPKEMKTDLLETSFKVTY